MTKKIAVLAGDGIGPEVMTQALRVLENVALRYSCDIVLEHADIGGVAFEHHGEHFPAATKAICDAADAILFGSVGGPVEDNHLDKWKHCEANAILALRKTYQLSANLRPAKIYPSLQALCPLKPDRLGEGVDMLVVRELTGDIYFGEHKQFEQQGLRVASDVAHYHEKQIEAIAHVAFQAALKRESKVTSVDKANVLATSRLWRDVVTEVARGYPAVTLNHMLVDNCAMQLLLRPSQFDVILTANLFGDILSDAASAIPGSLGLMPSMSVNASGFALYEPSGGSAPDIAGQDKANPIAQILCVAMLCRHTLRNEEAALAIEQAIEACLQQGYRTADIAADKGDKLVGARALTDQILQHLG